MLRRSQAILLFTLAILLPGRRALCQYTELYQPDPKHIITGPASIPLSDGLLKLELPKGLTALDHTESEKFYTFSQQPIPPKMLCVVVDPDAEVEWYADISYEAIGHIDDSDATELMQDSDKLLKDLQDITRDSYAKMPGGAALAPTIVGWYKPPAYNPQTHVLTAAFIGQDPGVSVQTVNFATTVLGRGGDATVIIVGAKKDAALLEKEHAKLNSAIHFAPGKDYASWQPSDGKADLAFIGLITGSTAVAAKTGPLPKLGSLLLAFRNAFIAILIGVGVFVNWIKYKRTGKPASTDPTPPATPP